MKRIAPDYYKDFACIKGECRHSCCIGWEIDIDDESLAYYKSIKSTFGSRIRENIAEDDGCTHFILSANDRCPFLNEDGLCDMIIGLGEESLCQICADHPRFRNFYTGREEIGLGLCCEAAASLILGRINPVILETIDDDGENEQLYPDEIEILELRDDLIKIAQDRHFPMEQRIANLLEYAQLEIADFDCAHWQGFLMKLERLDDSWADKLARLSDANAAPAAADMEIPFEQLLVYLIYRHVNQDEDLSGRISYCVLMWMLIRRMSDGGLNDLCELARLYSSEIEYSDENIETIIGELRRINPQI